MIKKLLVCSALLTLCSNMEAQNPESIFLRSYKQDLRTELNTTRKTIFPNKTVRLSENDMLLGYCHENDLLTGLGNNKASTFNCSIFLPEELINNLKGCHITNIRIGMNSSTNLESSSVWISRDLQNAPAYTQEITFQQGWNELTLDIPFEIDGSGLYIGYTTTLSSLDGLQPYEVFPIGLNHTPTENGLFIKQNDGAWENLYAGGYGSLMLQCTVTGQIPQNDILIKDVTERTGIHGEKTTLETTVTNKAKTAVSSIDLTYTLNGHTNQINDIRFEPALQTAESETLSFEIICPKETGYHDIQVSIDQINGQEDEYPADNTATGKIISLSQTAHKKVVMEEFTGTWCGYCPRGAVAMDKLTREMPDNYIGIAVHSDEMETASYYPLLDGVYSFPSATINRIVSCDPYYGTNNNNYGIKNDILNMLDYPSAADIKIKATYTDQTQTRLDVTSLVTFYLNSSTNPYQLAYVLTEDGVTGLQSNYYSGATNLPDDLAHLGEKGTYITDFEFNDVARGIYDCMGIEGSLEETLQENVEMSHHYTIGIPETVINKNNLKLTALLLNTETGEIINANQIALKDIPTTGFDQISIPLKATIKATNDRLIIHTPVHEPLTAEIYSCNGNLLNSIVFEEQTVLPTDGLKGPHIIRVTDGQNVIVRKLSF